MRKTENQWEEIKLTLHGKGIPIPIPEERPAYLLFYLSVGCIVYYEKDAHYISINLSICRLLQSPASSTHVGAV